MLNKGDSKTGVYSDVYILSYLLSLCLYGMFTVCTNSVHFMI